jgi:ubiquinone/menaquinone biosynthesis C-methylase UbiE
MFDMRKYSLMLEKIFYGENWIHPYRIYESKISDLLKPNSVILDAGCGRCFPTLRKFAGVSKHLFGLDICGFDGGYKSHMVNLINANLTEVAFKNGTFDLVISRSVLEHIENPTKVCEEIYRVLKPGGQYIFLTPNLFDYGTILARIIPNRFHPKIVRVTEGRSEKDTFPTYYRLNSEQHIKEILRKVGFKSYRLEYLGQYPSYFLFNPILFLIGSTYDKLICKAKVFRKLRGWILVVLEK